MRDRILRQTDELSARLRLVAKLQAALNRIDGINDNPARYNPEIDAVIRSAFEQPDN